MNFIKKLFSPIVATIKFFSEHFKGLLFLLILILIFGSSNKNVHQKHNLERINLTGTILDVNEVLKKIDKARQNKNVKGVLLVVNSPGGAVAPSIELSYAIKRLKQEKPVVVYASGIMASGSYYASIWANEIVANPGSMVGSIGVIIQGANFKELMDKIGVKTQVVKAGKFKQVGTADREWLPYEKKELQKIIYDTYDMFVRDVANARNLKVDEKTKWADAHIFTARQSKEVGLIDKVGVFYDAQEELIKLSKVSKPIWNKEDELDKFLKKFEAKLSETLQIYFPNLYIK